MQIVIPMAGRGERFLKAGFKEPKPLIRVLGKPMIEHIVNLFPKGSNFVFICNKNHLENTNLGEILKKIAKNSKTISIDEHKLGPVKTLLEAQSYINDNEEIIVSYCDFSLIWNHEDFYQRVKDKDIKSASVCYRGFHPHLLGENVYAGVRVGDSDEALEIREKHSYTKNKMDTWQQAGLFYFDSGKILKKYCDYIVRKNIKCNNEHYISLLFNAMIKDGHKSIVYPADMFCQWGTPKDLAQFNKWIELAKLTLEDNIEDSEDKDLIIDYWKKYLKSINA